MDNLNLELAKSIQPNAIENYFASRGCEVHRVSDLVTKITNKEQVAYLSKDQSRTGYAEGILSIIKWSHSEIWHHPNGVQGILNDLIIGPSDTVRFRIEDDDNIKGTISITKASHLIALAKTSIEESERTMLSKMRQIQKRKSNLSQGDWSKNCRFGQTEIGSYIVTLICPVGLKFCESETESLLPLLVPEMDHNGIGRAVSTHLLSSLEWLHGMAESKDHAAINSSEFKKKHISPILIRSLSQIAPNQDGELSISCAWSRAVKPPEGISNCISFTKKHHATLVQAADSIKGTKDAFGRISCQAFIVGVHAHQNLEARTSGNVNFKVWINGKFLNTTIKLDTYKYDKAVEYHRVGKPIEIIGKVMISGRTCTFSETEFIFS